MPQFVLDHGTSTGAATLHANPTADELIEHLRELAIRNGQRAMVDAIDDNLRAVPDGFVSKEDLQTQIEEAEDDAREQGKEEGRQDAKNELDDEREQIEEAAFNEGRADALVSAARAADVARVDALLQAFEKIRCTLLQVVNGVVDEPGHLKRPAKIGELKRAMQSAVHAAVSAVHHYNLPNGA